MRIFVKAVVGRKSSAIDFKGTLPQNKVLLRPLCLPSGLNVGPACLQQNHELSPRSIGLKARIIRLEVLILLTPLIFMEVEHVFPTT